MTHEDQGIMRWKKNPWKSPEEWNQLQQGLDCPFCANMSQDENEFSYKVIELQQSFVRFSKNQHMKGWTTVVFKRHANELFELSNQELAEFWQDVAKTADALDKVYKPVKINYCIFGHHFPHIHCHLLLHFFGEDASKPVKMDEKEKFLAESEYLSILAKLRKAIVQE